ncbi:glycosyl transferase family 1 [Rhodopirellula sp. SM50]|nr:glycosyltransferase family 4 protein [Rhodopirellula sp. SM50]PAY17877.1 glycosyl transferase family 1 [Rhodopirellula sp. SM50]
MITFSHPTGNQNVRHALLALEDEGLVSQFVTSVAAFPGNVWHRLSQTSLASEFSRRCFDTRVRNKTIQLPWRELGRMIAPRVGLRALTAHESGPFCIDRVYRAQDRAVADRLRSGKLSGVSAVYCYEDAALETFRAAKELDIRCIYDLPIGYWRSARRIQTEEAQRLPEWAATMPAIKDSDEKVARKDQELQLADTIIVASSFTAKTLGDVPFTLPESTVIPYGCPQAEDAGSGRGACEGRKLRVLFVGGLSQRKGLAYLFEAMETLGSSVELTIIGRKPNVECAPLEAGLRRYRWIESLPHDEILKEMRNHDVFVFPSLFEGFGLVITEALSQGLPVIATPNTCAPDILTDGEDGFIVPIRNSDAIAEKLELLSRDRARLVAMSDSAVAKGAAITWNAYRNRLVQAIHSGIAVDAA